ncbi:MAG: hypothetical protein IJN78_03235 [Clostridia bacterium]|nr:hypothetical protein [Clostridia bacterium]
MPKFWSYISNGTFTIGCTEQTVYIYDKNGEEKAKFKDLTYAYNAEISPDSKKAVVKTTDGRLAVYSLEEMKLLKKFRFSKTDGGQDAGFCFSADGKQFFNLESHGDGREHCLSVYETENFTPVKQLFYGKESYISCIEYDKEYDSYFVLGIFYRRFRRNKYFAAELRDDELKNITYIDEKDYIFYDSFKDLEKSGFTQQAYRWSHLYYEKKAFEGLSSQKRKISDLVKK